MKKIRNNITEFFFESCSRFPQAPLDNSSAKESNLLVFTSPSPPRLIKDPKPCSNLLMGNLSDLFPILHGPSSSKTSPSRSLSLCLTLNWFAQFVRSPLHLPDLVPKAKNR